MTVAAANKGWLPHILGSVGELGRWKVSKNAQDEGADAAMDRGESPMYVFNRFILTDPHPAHIAPTRMVV
jgi:hypothetical protein